MQVIYVKKTQNKLDMIIEFDDFFAKNLLENFQLKIQNLRKNTWLKGEVKIFRINVLPRSALWSFEKLLMHQPWIIDKVLHKNIQNPVQTNLMDLAEIWAKVWFIDRYLINLQLCFSGFIFCFEGHYHLLKKDT